MADVKPLNSAYGTKPGALPPPTPQAGADAEFDAFLAAMPQATPGAPAPRGTPAPAAPAPVAGSDDPEFDAFMASPDAQFAPEPGFVETNLDFKGLVDRALVGLGANKKEAKGALEAKYGPANVRNKDGKLWVKRPGSKQFTVVEPEAFSIIGDLIADNMRSFVQEGYMVPGEATGAAVAGATGAMIGLPTGPGAAATAATGAAGGALAARAGLARPSIEFADQVAASFGVPQDPTRDKAEEAAYQAGFELLGPFIGKIARGMGRYIPGTEAFLERRAKNAAKKAEFALEEDSQQILQTLRGADEAAVADVMGNRPLLSPDQINPRNAAALTAAGVLRNTPELQNFYVDQGKAIKQIVLENLSHIAEKTGKGQVPDKFLGQAIGDAATELGKAEGRVIGQYKQMARDTLRGQRLPLPDGLVEIISQLQVELGSGRPGALGITDPNQMKAFEASLSDLVKRHQGKGLSINDLEEVISVVGDMNPTAARLGGSIKSLWGGLTGELRTFRREAIKQGLPDDATRKGFDQVMDSFSSNYDAIRNIADSINTNMGANAVIRSVFSRGKEALGDVQALKAVLGKEHPEVWDRLKSEWVNSLAEKHLAGGKPSYGAFMKELNGLGEEVLDVIWDGKSKQRGQLMEWLAVGKRATETQLKAGPLGQSEGAEIVQNVGKLAFASKYLGMNAIYNLLQMNAEKNAIRDILTKEGAEQFLTRVPQSQKAYVSKFLNELGEYTRMNTTVGRAVSDKAAKTAIRAEVQNPASETGGE